MSNNEENARNGGQDLDADDFDAFDDFDEGDGDFDDFNDRGTLGDLWRNNPFVKVGVILAALAFIVGGVILFGGGKEDPAASRVARSANISEAPGTSEVSESYRDAVKEKNIQNVEDALREGTSAVPIPVEPPKGTLPLQIEAPEEEDPLDRWRRMQEERIKQQQIIARETPSLPEEVIQEPAPDTRTPAVNALAQSMSAQMESVLGSQKIPEGQRVDITSISYLENLRARQIEEAEQLAAEQRALAQAEEETVILVPAGDIAYAQLITEANTDAPGPVLAQIVSGPLRGARLLGSFESTNNYLILNFSTVVIDGVSQSVQAVALDPDTTLTGVATDINRRYFQRVVLPAAAEFVKGLTEAISESGTTSIFIEGDTVAQSEGDKSNRQEVASGISEAGEAVADIFEEEAALIQPMIKVRAGTPLGILFLQPVLEE